MNREDIKNIDLPLLRGMKVTAACLNISFLAAHSQHDFNAYYNTLSDYRCDKIDRLRSEQDKRRSLAAGLLTDYMLQQYGLRERDVTHILGRNDKPSIKELEEQGVQFSLSHAGDYAVIAWTDPLDGQDFGSGVTIPRAIGIDIEQTKPVKDSLVRYSLNDEEYAEWQSLPAEEKDAAFIRLWTCKEAQLKATGEGIAGMKKMKMDSEDHFSTIKIGENYVLSIYV